MITAIDTNILLDILIPDEAHSLSSKRLLDRCLEKGQLVICEVVYAELSSQFLSERELKNFLLDTGIRVVPSSREVLYLAPKQARMGRESTADAGSQKTGRTCCELVSPPPTEGVLLLPIFGSPY
jgi:predicted nucleic acid-binding protein